MRLRRVTSVVVSAVALLPGLVVPASAMVSGYTGLVRDQAGAVVPGACLTLFRTETEPDGTFCADVTGQYTISGVPGDVGYRVRVEAPGYRTHWWPDAPDHLNAEPVWVPVDSQVHRDVTVGVGAGTLLGRITTPSGAPAAATVSVWAVDRDWRALGYATVAGDGRYRLDNLAPGRYQISIYDPVHGIQWVTGRERRRDATIHSLGDGQTLRVDERWLPLGAVRAKVTDALTGEPVERPCLSLADLPEPVSRCGSAGEVRIDDVPPGHWEYSVTAAPSHFSPDRPGYLDVVRERTTEVALTLTPGTGLETSVWDAASGEPVPAVCVRLVPPKWGGQSANLGGWCSDEQGRLAVGPLAEVANAQLYAYQVRDPYQPPERQYGAQWVTADGGTGDQRQALTVALPERGTVRIPPVRMDPAGTISGVIRDAATGDPVPDVCAHPYAIGPDHGPGYGPHCSAADGRYTIDDLGPYHWPVEFTPSAGSGYAWQWSGDVPDRFSATTHLVPAGGTVRADARLVAGGVLAGRLTRDGVPVSGGQVWTHHRRTGDLAGGPVGWTGPDGRFAVGGHRTQDVYVEYRDELGTCWYGRSRSNSELTASPVRLTAGGTTSVELDLVSPAPPAPAAEPGAARPGG